MSDEIRITDLQLRCSCLEPDHWGRPSKEQPLVCNVLIQTSISAEASIDDLLPSSCNYGAITKAIEQAVRDYRPTDRFVSLEVLAELLAAAVISQGAPRVQLTLERPRAHLSAGSIGVQITRAKDDPATIGPSAAHDKLVVSRLEHDVIIGLNEPERHDTQRIIVDLAFETPPMKHLMANTSWSAWKLVLKQVEKLLGERKAGTIESLCEDVASLVLRPRENWNIERVSVSIAKPHALMFAKYPSVKVTRSRSDLAVTSLRAFHAAAASKVPIVLGVGSNLGERFGNITKAMRELESNGVKVVNSSFLYESEPMYVTEQDPFLNAVIMGETEHSPGELLVHLKNIEERLDRQKTIRNGPRTIDLDILFYDDEQISDKDESQPGWLNIPHKSISEREFVLRPLNDVAPGLRHPKLPLTPNRMLERLLRATPSTLHRVMPLSSRQVQPLSSLSPMRTTLPNQRTLIMSIMNVTPDSFSDGGHLSSVDAALEAAREHVAAGADILDIGGMSTRPGAADVSPEEEAERVVPVIKAIRAAGIDVSISIDTFRPLVARAAIQAGADIINDVMGGREPDMLTTMAELDVPIILMHSRGTPATMSRMTEYEGGVLKGVKKEMTEMLEAALKAGIKRWNIILDPGIGFAKTAQQNLLLLRSLRESVLTDELAPYPVLVGLSRKKFIGTITGKEEASARVHGTMAGVTLSIQQGAHIVRVHDTAAARDAVRMTDAILGAGEDA